MPDVTGCDIQKTPQAHIWSAEGWTSPSESALGAIVDPLYYQTLEGATSGAETHGTFVLVLGPMLQHQQATSIPPTILPFPQRGETQH